MAIDDVIRPTPLFHIEPKQLRQVVKEVANRDISSEDAQKHIDLFGEDLDREITVALRNHVRHHYKPREAKEE